MPWGGRRPGQGRPKGSKTDRTKAVAVELALTGTTPLEVLMQAMRYYLDLHANSGITAAARASAIDKAAGIAKDAAPYMHPRLASVVHGGKPGSPVLVMITGDDAKLL